MRRYKMPTRAAWEHHTNSDYDAMIVSMGDKEIFISGRENGLLNQNHKGLFCVPNYPTYSEDMDIPSSFGEIPFAFYGYSSHVHGISDALIAISRGALLIEKHCTLSKAEESIKDNSFALSPAEFADMVRYGKEIHRLIS